MDITKLQDNDGHWYWIPNDRVREFCSDKVALDGKEYMECPDDFEEFIQKYSMLQTGGDPDLMPDYFMSMKINIVEKEVEKELMFGKGTEKSIAGYDTLSKIVEQLEKCGYDCEAGSLVMNTAFMSLKRIAEKQQIATDSLKEKGVKFYPTKNESCDSGNPIKFLNDEIGHSPPPPSLRQKIKKIIENGDIPDIQIQDINTLIIENYNSRWYYFDNLFTGRLDLKWKYTVNGDIPVPEPNKNYSQVHCLVVRKGNNYSEILYHNDNEQNWDGADRDDYECDFLEVEKWVSLNELEKFLNR